MMKSFGILLVGVAALIHSGCSSNVKLVKSAEFSMERYKRIAVMDFQGNNINVGTALAESLVPALMESGFEVVERSALEKLLKEQKLGLTGALNSSQISQIGQIAGVNAIIFGNFQMEKKEKKRMFAVRKRGGVFRSKIKVSGRTDTENVFTNISLRLVDTETGKIILSSTSKNDVDTDAVDEYFDKLSKEIRETVNK
jgi:curli biogenesis system outer membrane secretion channel CsgG